MTVAYFDCFSGISGDMTLGALVDLGVPLDWLKAQLVQLPLSGFDLASSQVMRNGIQAVQVDVVCEETHHHRDYGHIKNLLTQSPLPDGVKADSLAVFERIARAEAKIHGCELDRVHFHEVGGIDAIVDIVGTCLAKAYLGIDTIMASRLPLGQGFVHCAHGTLPVPAPAVLEILKGIPVYSGNQQKELVTPTGAAILAALAKGFVPMPSMEIEKIGYGAGTHELVDQPNALRVVLGALTEEDGVQSLPGHTEMLVVVETNIDDMNPEIYGYLMERLLEDGALDVYWIPIQMKKNRPAVMVQVLCSPDKQGAVMTRLLAETTSLGIRHYRVHRTCLPREVLTVQTPFGAMTAKKVTQMDGTDRIVPEFESCRKIALEQSVPLQTVYEAVRSTSAAGPGTVSNASVLQDKQQLDKKNGKL